MHHGNRHMLSFKIETCATMILSNLTPPSLRAQTITSSPTVVFSSKDLVTAVAKLPELAFCFGIVPLVLHNQCSALFHSNFTRLCVNYLNKMPRYWKYPVQTLPTTNNTPVLPSQILESQAWGHHSNLQCALHTAST